MPHRITYSKENERNSLLSSSNHYKYQAISIIDEEPDWRTKEFTLNLSEVTYTITETIGKWYQGACFRKKRQKRVLNNVTAQFKNGEITAVLGSSGIAIKLF